MLMPPDFIAVISFRRARRPRHAHEHRHGRHREDDLEDEEGVEVEDHLPPHRVLLDVVDEVHEVGEEEDRREGEEDEADVARPGPRDVAVEDRGEAEGEAGDADHDHGPGGGQGGGAPGHPVALHRGHEREVVGGVQRVEGGLPQVQPQQHERDRPQHDVGAPHREERHHHAGVAGLLPEADEDVVDEDDADREGEGGGAGLLAAPERQRLPEQAEHDAGEGDRELLVPLDVEAAPLLPRLALRRELMDLRAELGQRHLPVALRERQLREELVVRQGEGHRREVARAVLGGAGRVERVLAAPAELETDLLLLLVDGEAPLAGEDQALLAPRAGVLDEQVLPQARVRRDVGDVEHHAPGQEVGGERAGLDGAAGLGDREREDELSVGLVGGGQGDGVDVERDEPARSREEEDRRQQAQRAHPDRPQGHDLAVARHPPEGEEDSEEEGHRDRDGEDAGKEGQEDPQDRVEVGAVGDQDREEPGDLVDEEDEGEDEEAEGARSEHLPDDVAVEDPPSNGVLHLEAS
jgi:hypothetical protein